MYTNVNLHDVKQLRSKYPCDYLQYVPCEEEKQGYPGHDLQGYPGQETQVGRQDMYVDPTGTEKFYINYITVLIYK